jgi:hypothetical protein
MKVDTTINIGTDLIELLERVVLLTGKSKSIIISLLMVRLAQCHDRNSGTWKRVRYQARGTRGKYRRIHIYLREQEYELFIDLRKFCKQSVSRLVVHAIQLYLDEIINDVQDKSDYYPSISYLIEKVNKDGATCWILTWGISTKQASPGRCIT